MDWFVVMVKRLVLFLFLQMVPFFMSNRLKEDRSNNQVKYEALLFGLEFLQSMGVKHLVILF
jgi:ribonuclease HI